MFCVDPLRTASPYAEDLFRHQGWQLPDAITRVYDAQAAMQALLWTPLVTFESVLHAMELAGGTQTIGSRFLVWDEVARGAF